jgi:hypothetical protein
VLFVAEIASPIDKALTTQTTQQAAETQIGIDPIFNDDSH